MSYFLYRSECDDCYLILCLTSQTTSPLTVYVNMGTTMPTTGNYTLKTTTIHSEVIALDRDRLNVTSMREYFVIGVVSTVNTTC